MGSTVLRNLLISIEGLDLDDSLYIDEGTPVSVDSPITITKFNSDEPEEDPPGKQYLLDVEQLRNAIDAAEGELGRRATISERFRAVVHFIDHDAFADVDILLGKSKPMN